MCPFLLAESWVDTKSNSGLDVSHAAATQCEIKFFRYKFKGIAWLTQEPGWVRRPPRTTPHCKKSPLEKQY
jgi:hypothetical protein